MFRLGLPTVPGYVCERVCVRVYVCVYRRERDVKEGGGGILVEQARDLRDRDEFGERGL